MGRTNEATLANPVLHQVTPGFFVPIQAGDLRLEA